MLVKQYSTYLIINKTFQRTTPNISCLAIFEQVGFIERLHLNSYLLFPYVGQAFMIERTVFNQKSGKETREIAYGITSKTPHLADAAQILKDNRGHWCIENTCQNRSLRG